MLSEAPSGWNIIRAFIFSPTDSGSDTEGWCIILQRSSAIIADKWVEDVMLIDLALISFYFMRHNKFSL